MNIIRTLTAASALLLLAATGAQAQQGAGPLSLRQEQALSGLSAEGLVPAQAKAATSNGLEWPRDSNNH